MRILITGINGFVGGHLVEALHAEGGHTLVGLSRSGTWPAPMPAWAAQIPVHALEITDRARVAAVLHETQPDWIFHLAGYANTGRSFREPDLCWQDNVTGTRSLYDAIAEAKLTTRVLFVSTGLIYGDPSGPVHECDEQTELRPVSPYATSKAAADLMSYQYTRSHGLDIVRIRLFNQIGPRQSADYATANWARQIAAAEVGMQDPVIETGDLSSGRDLTDVRDIVSAFRLLMEKGNRGEAYNAGHGRTWRMQEVLERLVAHARVPVKIHQRVEPGRKSDTAVSRANANKLRETTGWNPRYELNQSLSDILDYWREMTASRHSSQNT